MNFWQLDVPVCADAQFAASLFQESQIINHLTRTRMARSLWYHAPWRQRPCVKYYYLIWGAAFYVNTRLLKIAMTASGISSTWHERKPGGLLWFIYTSFLQLQIFKKIIDFCNYYSRSSGFVIKGKKRTWFWGLSLRGHRDIATPVMINSHLIFAIFATFFMSFRISFKSWICHTGHKRTPRRLFNLIFSNFIFPATYF